jgi:hypothetical protein
MPLPASVYHPKNHQKIGGHSALFFKHLEGQKILLLGSAGACARWSTCNKAQTQESVSRIAISINNVSSTR